MRAAARQSLGITPHRPSSLLSTMAAAKMEFHGVYTALVTPFTADGASVDYESLQQLVERQIRAGVDGLVPVSWSILVACLVFSVLTNRCDADGLDG